MRNKKNTYVCESPQFRLHPLGLNQHFGHEPLRLSVHIPDSEEGELDLDLSGTHLKHGNVYAVTHQLFQTLSRRGDLVFIARIS